MLVSPFVVDQNLTMTSEPISCHEARHVAWVHEDSRYLHFSYVAVGLEKRCVLLQHLVEFFDMLLEACPVLPWIVNLASFCVSHLKYINR